jgi:hypothetical protein
MLSLQGTIFFAVANDAARGVACVQNTFRGTNDRQGIAQASTE